MKPLPRESFSRPLWVVVRMSRQSGFRLRNGNSQSPIEYALQGPWVPADPMAGKDALHEVLCRFLRRRPVLAADFDKFLSALTSRYRTDMRHLRPYPSRHTAIGYVRAKYRFVYADADIDSAPTRRAQQQIECAISARNHMLGSKKYADISGIHREQMILLTEAKAL